MFVELVCVVMLNFDKEGVLLILLDGLFCFVINNIVIVNYIKCLFRDKVGLDDVVMIDVWFFVVVKKVGYFLL